METETGLRQAMGERVKPVMCINQLDQVSPRGDKPDQCLHAFTHVSRQPASSESCGEAARREPREMRDVP